MCFFSNPIQDAMLVVYMLAFKTNTSSVIQTNGTIIITIVKGLAIHPVIFYQLNLHLRLGSIIHYVNLQSTLFLSKGISTASKTAFEAFSYSWATIPDAVAYLSKGSISQSTNNADDYDQSNYSSYNWSNYNRYPFVIFIALMQCVIGLRSIIVMAACGHALTPWWGSLCGVLTAVGVIVAVCYIIIADCPFAKI